MKLPIHVIQLLKNRSDSALEDSLKHTLEDIILRHQNIPMKTIDKEYNDYLQSLITIKYNNMAQ